MALPQDEANPEAVTAPPVFQWGAGGARMTPEQIAAQRKVAEAMAAKSGDYTPIRSVWQGVARAAQGIAGGYESGLADRADRANSADNTKMIAALLSGGGGAQAAAPAAVADAAPSAAPASAPQASLDPETTGYINTAADKFGIDPGYLTRTAMIESGGNPNATNAKSGAAGLFQFMPKTAKEYELANPLDPEDSAMAAAELAKDNRDSLAASLGRPPTNAELYLAHQQGADGAAKLLTNPNAPAVSVVGRDAVLNNGGAEGMTAGQFANQWLGKFGAPAQGGAAPGGVSPGVAAVAAAQSDPAALPAASAPTQGFVVPGQPAPAAVAKVASGISAVNPAVINAMTSPYASEGTKKIAALIATQQMTPKEVHAQETDKDGNVWDVNRLTGQRTVAKAADKSPAAVQEYEYGQTHPGFTEAQLAKTKAGAAQLNNQNNIDMNSGQTYDKQLAEGLGKAHASLANGVEDAQTRARDIAAMQGAVDQIQKAGGTTGGMLPAQRLELQKSINAGAAAIGLDKPFSEADISDKEFLTKFNRSMAGAQAKNAVGSRVTNFEMSNFLKANPGLDMTITGNQRLLGIQSQIEQRNIAVGNAIRDATASAISGGKKIDPVTVQGIITQYDKEHHISDPTTGQDLTQSYALPEFQTQGTNAGLAAQHGTNLALPAEKTIGGKTYVQQDGHWYEK